MLKFLLLSLVLCVLLGAATTAPVGALVLSFENANDAKKVDCEGGVGPAQIVEENATEGTKSLMVEVAIPKPKPKPATRPSEPKRMAFWLRNADGAYNGAKMLSCDVTYSGDPPPANCALRITLRSSAGKPVGSAEQFLAEGKNSLFVEMVVDPKDEPVAIKITVDRYYGAGKFFLDNVRVAK